MTQAPDTNAETRPDPEAAPPAEQPPESGTSGARARVREELDVDEDASFDEVRRGIATRLAANRLREVHERPEFCDDLDVRYVERDASPDVIVCDGCTDDEQGGRFDAPPILWREGEGVINRGLALPARVQR